MSMRTTLALATLRRHPARTMLAVLGIAVAAALLLDMVMLATGMSESFRSLLLTRGYQLRVSPKGTLPFDSEATIDGATAIVQALRANPDIKAVSPSLGTTLALPGQTFPSVFTLGLESDVQGDYVLEAGRDMPVTGNANQTHAAVRTVSPLINEIVNSSHGRVTQRLTNVLSPDHSTLAVIYLREDVAGKTTGVTFATYVRMP